MPRTTLNLETVTPMFLHGHDNKILELRPPPFKALFRYWWRTVQDCEVEPLRRTEAKLFGSTDGKAPLSIRTLGKTNLDKIRYKPLPHKPDNDRRGIKMPAYKASQSFELYLITKNEPDACRYKQIAKLGFLLGGVGNRSRRGFGSIRETDWNFPDVCDLRNEVLETLNTVARDNRFQINDEKIIESKLSSFPNYPVIQRIFFGELTSNVDNLLVKIGRATSDAKQKNRDHALGDGKPRMASPVVVRIQMASCHYVPVVTQLYSVYPPGAKPETFQEKQHKFIEDIIR